MLSTISLIQDIGQEQHLFNRSYQILNSHRQRIKEDWSTQFDHSKPEKLAFLTVLQYDTPFILAYYTNLGNLRGDAFFKKIFEGHAPTAPKPYETSQYTADWIDSINFYTDDEDGNSSIKCMSVSLKYFSQYLRNGLYVDDFIECLANRIWKKLTNNQKNIFRKLAFVVNLDFFILPQIEKGHYECLCGKNIEIGTDDDWESFTKDETFPGFHIFGVSKPFSLHHFPIPSHSTTIPHIGIRRIECVTLYDFEEDGIAFKMNYDYRPFYRFFLWPEHYDEMLESLF
jgi:hypothetical protein